MGIAKGVASAVTQKAMAVIGPVRRCGAAVQTNFPLRRIWVFELMRRQPVADSAFDGLPTTTSSMTGMAQLIAPVSKSLKDATNISCWRLMTRLGKSTALQANAIEQYRRC